MFPVRSDAFQWSGSLDCKTGLANSIERSEMINNVETVELIQRRAHELFSNYPKWLVRRRVTFGSLFLRERSICDPLFGSRLLTFDSPFYNEENPRNKVEMFLPILGGILTNEEDPQQSEENNSLGSLHFKLTVIPSKNQATESLLELETRVVEFKPALAGSAPVGILRKMIYLLSQRLVHAYVMWRYHKYISSELSNIKSSDEIQMRTDK